MLENATIHNMTIRITPLWQWIFSFIVWDVVAFIPLLFICFLASDLCGGIGFAFLSHYLYPFDWLSLLDTRANNFVHTLYTSIGAGTLLHATAGLCIGILTRGKKVSWDTSLSTAFVTLIMLTIAINFGLIHLGIA